MNIPFYRHVKCEHDGHCIYQCLQCGETIDVGNCYYYYSPLYCCFCGVEYKGVILPKRYDYIEMPNTMEVVYCIEKGYDYGNASEISWESTWRTTDDPKMALELLKEEQQEIDDENKEQFPWQSGTLVCRLVRIEEKKFHHNIRLDIDEYKKRTGRKFNRDEYKRVKI